MHVTSPPVQTWEFEDAGGLSRRSAGAKVMVHADHGEMPQQGGPGEGLGEEVGSLAVCGDHGRHDGGPDFLAGAVPAHCEVFAGCFDDFGGCPC